jgi:hypothetical protein
MLRLLPAFAIFAFALFALIDCLSRDEDEFRGVPRIIWVLIILLFPLLGPVAWFLAGRIRDEPAEDPVTGSAGRLPSRKNGPATRRGQEPGLGSRRPSRPLAPDDDPEFLRSLKRRIEGDA